MNTQYRKLLQSFKPDRTNTRSLRDAFARFATGVTVVTCASQTGRMVAMTANSFSSLSLEPPLVMWAASCRSKRAPAFLAARHSAIHILSADQKNRGDLFARDGFGLSRTGYKTNDRGVPLLPDCLARFECLQTSIHDAGDHRIIVGEVLGAAHREGDALVFFGGGFSHLPSP